MRTVFTGGLVFDGTGKPPAPLEVAIENGIITAIAPQLEGEHLIDISGCTLMPGIIDCHVHVILSDVDVMGWAETPFSLQFFHAAENLRRTLDAGVTTVRDAAGADLGIRRALELGMIEGPRMQISVNMISQTGGHDDDWHPSGQRVGLGTPHPGMPKAIADGVGEVRRIARTLIRAGADVLKVAATGGVLSPRDHPAHTQFRPDELEAIVAEANAVGIPVMAHAQGSEGVKNALRAGVRSIEHGIWIDDEAIDLFLERDAWLVPTLIAPHSVLEAAKSGTSVSPAMLAKAREVVDIHAESVRRASEAGVRIALGTDAGVFPHGGNLRELALLGAVMSPADALVAATSSAAGLLGLGDRIGTIAIGKEADLIVVRGDAYELDALPSQVEQVWLRGSEVRGPRSGVLEDRRPAPAGIRRHR